MIAMRLSRVLRQADGDRVNNRVLIVYNANLGVERTATLTFTTTGGTGTEVKEVFGA